MIVVFKFADGRERTIDAKDAPLALILKEEIERKFVMKRDLHDKPIYVEELRPYFNGEGPLGGLAASIVKQIRKHQAMWEGEADFASAIRVIGDEIERGDHLKENTVIVPDGIV
jgi:hypothetical protein